MNCYIHPLTSREQPFLWEMLYQALHVPAGQPAFPRKIVNQPELARYAQGWGGPEDRGFWAYESVTARPVGAVWLRLLTGQYRGYGYVNDETPELSMAVLPPYRGQGIGTQLLGHLLASEAGRCAISLSVSVENPAQRLYERSGFTVVSLAGTSLVMRREAESNPSDFDKAV